mgnify:CR=1 FL=1
MAEWNARKRENVKIVRGKEINRIYINMNVWKWLIGIHENDTSEYDKRINEIVTNGHMDKWNMGKWRMTYGIMRNEKWRIEMKNHATIPRQNKFL